MDNNNIKTSLAFIVIVATSGMAIAFTTTVQKGTSALSSDVHNLNLSNNNDQLQFDWP